METKQTVGSKIAILRKARGLTQADIGALLNISYQAVSKWERDESCPDFETLSRLAQFFNVPISYFEKGGEEVATTVVETDNKTMLGVCKDCGKVVYEGDAGLTSPTLICKNCNDRRLANEKLAQKAKELSKQRAIEAEKAREDREKAERAKSRNKGLIWGGIAAVAAIVIGIFGGWDAVLGMLVLDIFLFPFIAQLFWDGAVLEVVECGGKIIGTPGIIFTFDLDGFIFLIAMKILFAVLRFLVYIITLLFFIVIAMVIAPFTFAPALLRVNKEGV